MVMRAVESAFRTKGFGVFEVDFRAAELRKHGVRIKLQDQPFQILSLLLEHPGEVVTRDELREKLWPAHTFVDFDRSLNKAMTKLRAALGDSADNPRYVETIPRHGYRFLAPVYVPQSERAHEHAAGRALPKEPFEGNGKPTVHAPSRKRRFYGLAAAVVVVAAVVLVAIRFLQPATLSGKPGVVSPRRSVAVLGFTNLSGDAHEAWLSTAFSDWLTTELSAGGQLRTLPAENIARMKAELALDDLESLGRGTLEQIHKDLGTDLVVAGSYATLGANPQIRLDVRLFDTQSGETLYADSETGSQEGLFDLVSRAGEQLRANLGVRKITKEEAVEVATALRSNGEAARLYAEGLSKLRAFDALQAGALFRFFPDNLDYGLALANAEYKANKWKDALETLAALKTLPVPLSDDPRIELAEGDAAMPLGDTKRAEAAYVSAEQKARASGASLLVAKAMFAHAWLLEKMGRLDEADKAIHGARDLYLAAHDQRGVADAETGEAIALMFRGDYFSARERYGDALGIHQKIGNMHSVAGEFHNLAEIALFLGDVRGALQKSQLALQTYQEVGDGP